MVAVTSQDLPQELVDLIVDDIRQDPEALKSCFLLSPLWRESARRYLFEKQLIRGDNLQRGLAGFISLLDISPSVCAHIRTLQIADPFSSVSRPVATISAHVIAFILSLLPKLRILELDGVKLSERTSIQLVGQSLALPEPLPGQYQLDKLVLAETHFEFSDSYAATQLFNVLNLFSIVVDLQIRRMRLPSVPLKLPDSPHSLQVGSLLLEGTRNTLLIGPVRTLDCLLNYSTLKSFISSGMSSHTDIQITLDVLTSAAPYLAHIDMDFDQLCHVPVQTIDLSRCTQLASITLRVRISSGYDDSRIQTWCYLLINILSSIPCTRSIRHIMIGWSVEGIWDDAVLISPQVNMDWPKFNLVVQKFPALEKLEFRQGRYWNITERKGRWTARDERKTQRFFIRNNLKALDRRGLLVFSVEEDMRRLDEYVEDYDLLSVPTHR